MAQLAIKGHITRGDEVIELLEMLGGKNSKNYTGYGYGVYYFIRSHEINLDLDYKVHLQDNTICFTLEEFLEKFPYKVGDKVKIYDWINKDFVNTEITCMKWFDNEVLYATIPYFNLRVKDIQPYKEKAMEETLNTKGCIDNNRIDHQYVTTEKIQIIPTEISPYKVELILDKNFELQLEDEKIYLINKKPNYPTTYEECCMILQNACMTHKGGYKGDLIQLIQKLIICRDAYWKIAGEEMGLDKPWKPDWTNPDIDLYVIVNIYNQVEKAKYGYGFQSCLFAFPTEEMRDAFLENFDSDIHLCKEFL